MNEEDFKFLEENNCIDGSAIITIDDLPKGNIKVFNIEFDEILELEYVMSLTDGSKNKVYKIKGDK